MPRKGKATQGQALQTHPPNSAKDKSIGKFNPLLRISKRQILATPEDH